MINVFKNFLNLSILPPVNVSDPVSTNFIFINFPFILLHLIMKLILFLLYARSFPVVAQAEIKSILKSSGENYKKLRDK